MNILYFHANLLRDSYRCKQVRKRLIEFLQTNEVDALFISGIEIIHTTDLAKLKQKLSKHDCPIIDQNGDYHIHDVSITMDNVSMLIEDQRFVPLDGAALIITTRPELKSKYIALDLFADEVFAAYHSDMDSQTLLELSELIQGFNAPNKNHLH
jgi:hypothetical protein